MTVQELTVGEKTKPRHPNLVVERAGNGEIQDLEFAIGALVRLGLSKMQAESMINHLDSQSLRGRQWLAEAERKFLSTARKEDVAKNPGEKRWSPFPMNRKKRIRIDEEE